MLAPLTDLVGACGETKTTEKNKTKKLPWKWDPIHQQAFDDVKATITEDVVLAYPIFTKSLEIFGCFHRRHCPLLLPSIGLLLPR